MADDGERRRIERRVEERAGRGGGKKRRGKGCR